MLRYILKRLVAMIPTLFGITLITFMIVSFAPGDPVAAQFGGQGAGGGSAAAEGAGQGDQDRLADTIKAKKQLLGMLREDRSAHRWVPNATAEAAELAWPIPSASLPGWSRSITVSPDGATVFVGTKDGVLVALDATTLSETRRWTGGHTASIGAVAVSPSGQRVATGDDSGALRVWEVDADEPIGQADGDGKPLSDVLFADDDQVLVASNAGVIRLHRAATGQFTREYGDHIGAVYALESAGDGRFWSGGVDKVLRLWALDEAQPLRRVDGHNQAITDIGSAADGTLVTGCDDRIVRVWPRSGDSLDAPVELEGHYKQVTAVAISPDGQQVWSGSRDDTIRQWTRQGIQIGQSPENPGRVRDLVVVGGTALAAGDFWSKVPMVVQYGKWLWRTASLDFGRSFVDDEPVIDMIARALPITIGLNILAIMIIYMVSIPVGIYAAVDRGGRFDNITSLILFVLYSVPNFWLATILIMSFSSTRTLDIFPSGALHGPDPWSMSYLTWLADWGWHLVLPITVMVYAGFASLSRYVRTSMLEALSQDYVRTARAKGLSEFVVVFKHALRNALITIVTLIANLLPRLIGGSVIVEYIFSINGMGKLGFDSILSRDYPVIMAITTFSAVLTLMGILVSDILYSVVDPRVKVDA